MTALLRGWETFYMIVGSSAAALTGLQFVVIALSAGGQPIGTEESVGAFATPTIVHLSVVLSIAALIVIPRESAATLSICLAATGAGGTLYSAAVALRARRQQEYQPVFEDWLWHVGFPVLAYVALFVAGVIAWSHAAGALYVVAITTLFLLLVGIHNAWDSAVFIAIAKRRAPPQ
jgi:hypothetical protein